MNCGLMLGQARAPLRLCKEGTRRVMEDLT